MQKLSTSYSVNSHNLIETIVGTRIILTIFFLSMFVVFGIVHSQTSLELNLFLCQSVCILAFAVNPQFYFVSVKKLSPIAIIKTATGFVVLILTLLLISKPIDLPYVALINGAVTLLFFLAGLYYIFVTMGRKVRLPQFLEYKELLRNAAPLGISAFMIQIYKSADILILGFIKPGLEVGYYIGVYRIINVLTLLPGFFYLVFLPDLASITENYLSSKITKRYVSVLILSGLLIMTICYFGRVYIIQILLGYEYLPAVDVFSVQLLNVFLVFINVAIAHLFIVWNKHKIYLLIVTSGAVVNLICNALLIPQYGMMGAAIATVLAEVAVLVASLFYHKKIYNLSFKA